MKLLKTDKGIALVAAIVVTLIVSLVAVAIASTAVANRHLSNTDYEVNSGYVNAQAGLNMAETIIQTAKDDDFKNYVADFNTEFSKSAFADKLSGKCADNDTTMDVANDCFWWLGRSIEGRYASYPFLTALSADQSDTKTSYLADDFSKIYFRLEKRPEYALASGSLADDLGKYFFRVTAIASGNGFNQGLMKVQGQIQVFLKVDKNIQVSGEEEGDDGPLDVLPNDSE